MNQHKPWNVTYSSDPKDLQHAMGLQMSDHFEPIITMLKERYQRLAIINVTIADEKMKRWVDGRVQELMALVKFFEDARENMKKVQHRRPAPGGEI